MEENNTESVWMMVMAGWLDQFFMCSRMRLPGLLQLMFFDLIQSFLTALALP